MADVDPTSSLITLTINLLDSPIRRQKLAEWILKNMIQLYAVSETHVRLRDTNRLKLKEWKRYIMQTIAKRKAGMTILITDKIDLTQKLLLETKMDFYKDKRLNPLRR